MWEIKTESSYNISSRQKITDQRWSVSHASKPSRARCGAGRLDLWKQVLTQWIRGNQTGLYTMVTIHSNYSGIIFTNVVLLAITIYLFQPFDSVWSRICHHEIINVSYIISFVVWSSAITLWTSEEVMKFTCQMSWNGRIFNPWYFIRLAFTQYHASLMTKQN